jgi:hypothetical protein
VLPEQEQNGGDERTGVADADPEDEIGDVEGPADRAIEVSICGETQQARSAWRTMASVTRRFPWPRVQWNTCATKSR